MMDSGKKDRQARYEKKPGQTQSFQRRRARPGPRKNKTVVIEVQGGVVTDVANLPPGYEYRVIDHDLEETEEL